MGHREDMVLRPKVRKLTLRKFDGDPKRMVRVWPGELCGSRGCRGRTKNPPNTKSVKFTLTLGGKADFADCRVICLVKSVEKIAGNLIFGLKHP